MVESIKELREIAGSKKKQPLYMEIVSMKISIYITKLYLFTGLSADYVTMFMMFLIVLGSSIMAFGTLWMIFIGIMIIHFTIILDNVNGEVARYWKEDGLIGTYLEQVYHNLSIPFIFFGLAIGVFMATKNPKVLVFGFLSAIFGLPIILKSVKDAVIEERFDEIKSKKKRKLFESKFNVKGGGTSFGKSLYEIYDKFRAVWVFPANIVHITILSIIELANIRYGFMSPYSALTWYLYMYGFASAAIQFLAFFVNYKGRTVDHYYGTLFERKK